MGGKRRGAKATGPWSKRRRTPLSSAGNSETPEEERSPAMESSFYREWRGHGQEEKDFILQRPSVRLVLVKAMSGGGEAGR